MVNGIRSSHPRRLNKGRGSKFRVGTRVRQETPEEGRRTYRPKCCEYNNIDEDNSTKTLTDKNHPTSSQKFRKLYFYLVTYVFLAASRGCVFLLVYIMDASKKSVVSASLF